ncbi:MAG TPA: BolA family transcriptional regulator [Rhodobacteraceae bacterium]|nr:BolA family transcriptional regulator [Paracoccaceae bacterium]
MTYAERMREKLTEAFAPEALEIIDESEDHRGHGGYQEGGETHFKIVIKAAAFNGMSRVAQQRAVMAAVKQELDERVHALALVVSGV